MTKKKTKPQFEAWNLVVAQDAMQDVFLHPEDYHLEKNDKNYQFLLALNKKLDELGEYVKARLFIERHYFNLLNINLIINFYLNELGKVEQEVCARLWQYVAEVNENLESHMLSLPVNTSTREDPYSILLQDIIKSFSAVIKSVVLQKCVMASTQFNSLLLYEVADGLGAAVLPGIQAADPLIGLEAYSNEDFKIIGGNCSGLVCGWAESIFEKGVSRPSYFFDKKIKEYQAKVPFPMLKIKELDQHSIGTASIGDYLVPKKGDLRVFYIVLAPPKLSSKDSHAIGCRRIPTTDQIELYDPNFGIFLFNNEKNFAPFISFLFILYELMNMGFTRLQRYELGRQSNEAKSYIPHYQHINKDSQFVEKAISALSVFVHFYKEKDYSECDPERLASILIDLLKLILPKVNTQNEIKQVKNEINVIMNELAPKKETTFWASFLTAKKIKRFEEDKNIIDGLFNTRSKDLGYQLSRAA